MTQIRGIVHVISLGGSIWCFFVESLLGRASMSCTASSPIQSLPPTLPVACIIALYRYSFEGLRLNKFTSYHYYTKSLVPIQISSFPRHNQQLYSRQPFVYDYSHRLFGFCKAPNSDSCRVSSPPHRLYATIRFLSLCLPVQTFDFLRK